MLSRRTTQEETARIARRRLEMLSVELAGIRESMSPPAGAERSAAVDPGARPAPPASGVAGEAVFTPHGAAGQPAARGAFPDQRWDILDELPSRGRHARRPVSVGGQVGGWVHDRLPPTLQGRVRLTAGHLAVVAVLVAAGLGGTAWWAVRSDDRGTAVPAATWSDPAKRRASASEPTALVTPVADAAAASPTAQSEVVVDVAGKVRRPGIVTLPPGSRVVDAIEAAGGARPGVDLTQLNLARVLVDGEQIVVGVSPPGGVAATAASSPGTPSGTSGPMVNINAATQSELEELPGVGPVTAAAIIKWRSENGAFTAVDELLEVSGIGDATLAKIAPFVTL